MIRSSMHRLSRVNIDKHKRLQSLLAEYRCVGTLMVAAMWDGLFSSENTTGNGAGFHPAQGLLDCPKYVDYRKFNIATELSGRMLRALSTHVCATISAATEKRRKLEWKIAQPPSEKYPAMSARKRGKMLRATRPVKPCFRNAPLRLDTLCSDIRDIRSGGFVQLKSLGKRWGKIRLPFSTNRVSQKWSAEGRRLSGIEITERAVRLSYEIQRKAKRGEGDAIGVDQGMLTVASMSDGSATPATCPHGHSLSSVIDRLSRRRRGSKGFARAQKHRDNLIRWSINRTNLRHAPEVRLEKIWNIGYRSGRSRKLSHWTNTIIRDKIAALCEEAEVPFTLQSCTYRSQRCSGCGWVRKANRQGKLYVCNLCGLQRDADYNASCNHAADLPSVSWTLRSRKLNRKGFFWKPSGFTFQDGSPVESTCGSEELSVPRASNDTPNHMDSVNISSQAKKNIRL